MKKSGSSGVRRFAGVTPVVSSGIGSVEASYCRIESIFRNMQSLGIECCDIDSTERQLGKCPCFVWVLTVSNLSLVVSTVERTTFNHELSNLDPILTSQKRAIFKYPKIYPETLYKITQILFLSLRNHQNSQYD